MATEPAVIISAFAALISALSALVAVWNYNRERLGQKITAAKWQKEYFADLLVWSNEAMMLLSEALHLCDLDPEKIGPDRFFEIRHTIRIKLSAQIDRGRWFFPNYSSEKVGLHKHEAFRGYRPAVLDGLVYTYQEVKALDYKDASKNCERREVIGSFKRLFTSEIQSVLNPRSRDEEFRKLVENVRKA